VIAREMRKLVGGDEADFTAGEAAVEQRVPEDHTLGRPDPDREGVRRGRLVTDVLLADRRIPGVFTPLQFSNLRHELLIAQRMRVQRHDVRDCQLQ
jgi:hypothetical protein